MVRGVVEAAECFIMRWHRDEAESSWLRRETEDAKSDDKARWGGGNRNDTAVDECRNETVDRVWQGTGSANKWNLSYYCPRALAVLFGFR